MKLQKWVQAVDMDSWWLGEQYVCVCVCVCVSIVLWFSEMSGKTERGCGPGGISAMSQEETGEWKTSFFTSKFLTKKI